MFTEVDLTKPVFNIKSKKQAEESDVLQIKWPEHLRPEHQKSEFMILPSSHRMFFDVGSLGPFSARKLMETLLNASVVRKSNYPVEVLLEQDEDELEKILSLKELRTLDIVVTRPNPDVMGGQFEKQFKDQMKNQKARKFTSSLEAEEGKSLEPNEDTKKLAQVALSDGFVVGKGRNKAGRAVTVSTESHPLREIVFYDPKEQNSLDALFDVATKLLEKILRRRR